MSGIAHPRYLPVARGSTTSRMPSVGLDRNEVGSLLAAAGLGAAYEHTLISLLSIGGRRISEALGADINALGIERGYRTLTVVRKGGKAGTILLAPRTARAVDLAIGERLDGPIFPATRLVSGWTATAPAASRAEWRRVRSRTF